MNKTMTEKPNTTRTKVTQTTSHTPGPWEVANDVFDWWIRSAATKRNICDALLTDNELDYHLIAAAPDMLAALKECAIRCRYDGDLCHDIGDMTRAKASWRAALLAEAAIAKAECGL